MHKLARRVLPLLLACATSATALAQAQPQPTVVARMSMTSITEFNKLFADLGMPMTPQTDVKSLIESVPFIGAGNIATDKPLGFTIWAADPKPLFPIQDHFVVSVPATAGKITLADLKAAGATPLDATPDVVAMVDMRVRRTTDYVHFAESTFGLVAANDTPFAADYKDPSNIYVAFADLATFRKVAPKNYQDLAKQIVELPRMIGIGTPDDPKPVLDAMDKIDTLTLALSQDPANFLLNYVQTPSPFSTAPLNVPRPAFPANMIGRMHLVYPTPESAGLLEKQLATLSEETFAMGMPPVYHQRAKDLVLKLVSLNSRSSAVSLAVSVKDGKPTVYLVDQFATDVDAPGEILDLINEIAGLAQEGAGQKIDVQGATYTDGTHKVQRVTLTPDAAAGGESSRIILDEIQTGRTLYITFSQSDERAVAALADAGMDGKSTMIFAGDLDLGALLSALPPGLIPPLPGDTMQTLKTSWAGQKITFGLQSTAKGLQATLTAPKQIWRDLIKLSTKAGPPPAGVTPILP